MADQRVPTETTRHARLEALKKFFLVNLVEDGIDGTIFDCDVLDVIEGLKTRHSDE